MSAATSMKESLGRPGMRANANMTPAAIHMGRLLPNNWRATSTPRLLSEEARVSTMAPAMETSSDGIMVTRPSPTVKIV